VLLPLGQFPAQFDFGLLRADQFFGFGEIGFVHGFESEITLNFAGLAERGVLIEFWRPHQAQIVVGGLRQRMIGEAVARLANSVTTPATMANRCRGGGILIQHAGNALRHLDGRNPHNILDLSELRRQVIR